MTSNIPSNPMTKCQHGVYGAMPNACGLCMDAEIERLTRLELNTREFLAEAVAERDRLRAAIEKALDSSTRSPDAFRILAEALAGSHSHPSSESAGGQRHPDETTDAPAYFEWQYRCNHCGVGYIDGAHHHSTCANAANQRVTVNGDECRG